MKIIQVISLGYEIGGAELIVKRLKEILIFRGHEVIVLSSDLRGDKKHFSDVEFKGINPSNPAKLLFHLFNPYSYFKFRSLIREFKPDIVHIHTMSELSPSILFLLRQTPTIMTIHGPEEFTKSMIIWFLPPSDFKKGDYNLKNLNFAGKAHYFYYIYIQRYIYKLGFKNVDLFITPSKYIMRAVKKDLCPIKTLHNGIDLFKYCNIKNTYQLLFVGRFGKVKGIEFIISALPKILNKFPNAKLNIVGEGKYKNNLIKIVKMLKLDKSVKFIGWIEHNKLTSYYKNSSIFVMPSICPEAFGLVGIEAMSVGRPVIASNVGGIAEWLDDGETGYLVNPGNSEQIAEKVIKLFSDRKLMEQMGKNARKKAEQFSIEKHANEIEKIYMKVIEKYKTKEVS